MATGGDHQVTLGWSAPPNVLTYGFDRATNINGPYVAINDAYAPLSSYVDTGLENGVTYYYHVWAGYTNGWSATPASASATPHPSPPPPPPPALAPPGNFLAIAGDQQVTLSWSASTGAFGYLIGHATAANGPYTWIYENGGLGFVDTGLANGTTYYYQAFAFDINGNYSLPVGASATPQAPPPPPPPPPPGPPATPMGFVAAAGNGQVSLSWNASTGATDYVVSRATSSSGPFTAIAEGLGTSFVDTGLQNGVTYYYRVVASNSNGASSPASASATPVAPPPPPPLPGAPAPPTGLSAVPGDSQVTLSWNASAGATYYVVYRAASSSGPFTPIAEGAFTSFVDKGLWNGSTYYYQVVAANNNGASAPASASATPYAPPGAPATPTGFVATAGNGQVSLSWNASTGATLYFLHYATSSSGPFIAIAEVSGTTFVDAGLTNGTPYYFRLVAHNSNGSSAPASASATPQAPPLTPSGFVASSGDAQITLSWQASVGATSYKLKRATTSSGPFALIATVSGTSYADTGLANGTIYYYQLTALNSFGESSPTTASARPTQPLAAPTGLMATAGNQQISLSWNAVAFATSYNIKRATSSAGPFGAPTNVLGTSFVDSGLMNGTTYYYQVTALNNFGDSGHVGESAPASASATPMPPPATPAGFTATPGNVQVTLGWNAAADASSYHLFRATSSSGPFTLIGTVVGASFLDNINVSNGTTYYYRLTALNAYGESSPATASATPTAPLVPPTGFAAIPGNSLVNLSWNDYAGATSYELKRATTSGGPFVLIATPSGTSYADTGLVNGTTYYYQLMAVVNLLESGPATGHSTPQVPVPPPPLDSDGDGLSDADELALGTNPFWWDTDGDGWSDGDEVHIYHTDPLDPNSHPFGNPPPPPPPPPSTTVDLDVYTPLK